MRALREIDKSEKWEKREDADVGEVGKREGISLLRYAAGLFGACNESINQAFTAEELLRIARACEKSEWDVYPDQWTPRQLEEAAADGTVPRWEQTNGDPRPVYGEPKK